MSWEDVGSDRTFRWQRRLLGPLVDNCSHPGEHVPPAASALRDVKLPTGDDPSSVSINGPAAAPGRAQVST